MTAVRVLIVAGGEPDVRLLTRELQRNGFDVSAQRVETAEELKGALEGEAWDAVIADDSVPVITTAEALSLVREHAPMTPFILVAGAIDQAKAMETMQAGAQDYILKDDLARLPVALGRELREAEERRAGQLTEAALYESEARFRSLFEQTAVGINTGDRNGQIIASNPAFQRMLGYDEGELREKGWAGITHPDDLTADQTLNRELWAGSRTAYTLEKRYLHRDGHPVWTRLTVSLVRDATGQPLFDIAMVEDITERRAAEEQLLHQALHDALTDLPNRALFRDRLEQALRTASREHESLGVLLVDLDRFKEVNDALGHDHGDLLLQTVAGHFVSALRESDTVARLGGDEFAVLLAATDATGTATAADKLLAALAEPFILQEHTVYIAASVGIALYPEHGRDADTLLRRADVAMYTAKRSASGSAVYQMESDPHTTTRLALIAGLRQAIDESSLALYYQPKLDLRTGQIREVEALMRWRHPARGFIPPDQFIDLAEQTGLMKPLTTFALHEAARQVQRWKQQGLDVGVAVNLSAWNFQDPQLTATVRSALAETGVEAASLRLEITESALMIDPPRARETVQELYDLGLRLAIDDFGTGYSSLSYLHRLPVDEVKIDRSFVAGMQREEDSAIIVRAIIDLGQNLRRQVVAEGVETEAQLALLRAMGCDQAQGYYICRPAAAKECGSWLAAHRTD